MAIDHEPDDDDLCGHELASKPGMYCDRQANYDDDLCGLHSDETEGPGPPEGAANNQKHGMYADRSKYFQRLDDDEQVFIESMYESFLADAPFTDEHAGKATILWQTCIDLHKKQRANEYIKEEGMTQERTEGYHPDYGAITQIDENTLHIAYDRLSRTTTRQLKELGILDDPDSQQAEAQQSFLEVLAGDSESD